MAKSPYRVLIGNSEQTLTDLFVRILHQVLNEQFDLKVTKTCDLQELSNEANAGKTDLIVLVLNDIQVPESQTTGSVFHHIRPILDFIARLKSQKRTPVICLSSFVNPVLPETAMHANADFYFALPVDPDKLRRAILKCVKIKGKSPESFSIQIPRLPTDDQKHLIAAEGWLELGLHLEANEELELIAPELQAHPDVLEVRWQIFSKASKWLECIEVGNALVESAPFRPDGWIHRSYALHELKRTEEASDLLLPAADLFPGHWLIAYNLACYSCCLGNNDEAWQWLEDAFELGDPTKVKTMALKDPDLAKFWTEIGEM